MSKASDREIIDQALNAGAIAVTLDADFHALLAVSGAAGPSVIRIRREGLDAQALTGIVDKVLVEYALDLAQGSLITVKLNKTTSHQLPIGRR
jgi:predicted nuclease of predicted toxin-antitoxin system